MAYNPPHAQYPDVWRLGETGPQGVYDYLKWLMDDSERFLSAAKSMRYLRIGMHFLTVGQRFNEHGEVVEKLELNMWTEEFPPEVGAGGHAHSRDIKRLWSFVHPDARQTVTGLSLLPPTACRLPRLPIREGLLTILNKIDPGDGGGVLYYPEVIDTRLAMEIYEARIPPGTVQQFPSPFIHDVHFRGPGTGITVQLQGPIEPPELNTFDGLINFKGLEREDASLILASRGELLRSRAIANSSLLASTVLYREPDFTPDQLETTAQPISVERAEHLLSASLYTQEALGAVA